MSVNKVILLGNLGRDPEMKESRTGTTIANLSVATTKRVKGEDRTEWHRVVAFGKTAEFAARYLSKGRTVYVEGEIQTRSWESDGGKRYITEVVAFQLEAVGPRPADDRRYQDDEPANHPADGGYDDDGNTDDIPF